MSHPLRYLTAAALAAGLLCSGAAYTSVVPVQIDDVSIMIPLGDVTGNVGVAGATVKIGNRSAIADANGNFRINGLAPGTYTLTVSHANMIFTPTTVTIARGSRATVTVSAITGQPNVAASVAPVIDFEYDAEGNPTKTTLAKYVAGFAFATQSRYDSLARRLDITDAKQGITKFSYDAQDSAGNRVAGITDPASLSTSYASNGLGALSKLASPDTGVANQTYDAAGNLKTSSDSRGAMATYSYDALNRLTDIAYTLNAQSSHYVWTYDQTGTGFTNGVGRLTSTSFPGGSTKYNVYDAQGHLVNLSQSIDTGATLFTSYGYDAAGRINLITYPSGKVVSITYTGGLPSALTLSSSAQPLLTQIKNNPFGEPQSWQWNTSSGLVKHERSFDTSGRMVRYPLGSSLRDIAYDAADRISSYTHHDYTTGAAQTALDQSFGYDALGRLTSITISGTNTNVIGYDANGNRTSVTQNGVPNTYNTTLTSSNRLNSVTTPARNFSYDNAGNTQTDGIFSAVYGPSGRMSSLTKGGVTTNYVYNNLGQRIVKYDTAGNAVSFVYDQAGQLLGEYVASTGAALREYVWLGNIPVAVLIPDPANPANPPLVNYIHTDHLNTPRVVVDRNNNLRWTWAAAGPFGGAAPNNNPSGVGAFTLNLRFPGQYADQESGLFYNHFRDYDPATGRYVESDPIGLAGGINTYAYVNGNPLSDTDSQGLMGGGGGGSAGHPVSPQPAPSSCEDKCEHPVTMKTGGTCAPEDSGCAAAMQAAGLQPPYYYEYKTYDWMCLLKLGVAGKTVGYKGSNFLADQAPGLAETFGFKPWVVRGVGALSRLSKTPAFVTVAMMYGVNKLLDECECKKK
jgi:RHS repeat-associated protein